MRDIRIVHAACTFGVGLFAGLLYTFEQGVFTIALNVPINRQVLAWNPAGPPVDWEDARARWNLLNRIRTPLDYVSFVLFIWAASMPVGFRKSAGA